MICGSFIDRRCDMGPFIDGEYRSGAGYAIVNPATEEAWCDVGAADTRDVESAVAGAQKTFEQTWRDLSPGRRCEIMFAIARVIRENQEELAQLEMKSVGKPIADARDEVKLGGRIFEYYAGA